MRDVASFAAVRDVTQEFSNLRIPTRPKKVEFEDVTLSPEKITELKSRASKSVQERERRSSSRTRDP